MHSLTPSSDLRIADLPPDLREEGVRLKTRYHALIADAGLHAKDGAVDLGKLGDMDIVKSVDLGTLRSIAETAEALHALEYSALPEEVRQDCPYDEYCSPAFAKEAASQGSTPFQWAGKRHIAREEERAKDPFANIKVSGNLDLRGVTQLRPLPKGLILGGLFLTPLPGATGKKPDDENNNTP